MKTNAKITKIRNCPTTTQLKLLHWLMHLELSGGSGEGADGGWHTAHPAGRGKPSIALIKTKTHEINNQFTQIR